MIKLNQINNKPVSVSSTAGRDSGYSSTLWYQNRLKENQSKIFVVKLFWLFFLAYIIPVITAQKIYPWSKQLKSLPNIGLKIHLYFFHTILAVGWFHRLNRQIIICKFIYEIMKKGSRKTISLSQTCFHDGNFFILDTKSSCSSIERLCSCVSFHWPFSVVFPVRCKSIS